METSPIPFVYIFKHLFGMLFGFENSPAEKDNIVIQKKKKKKLVQCLGITFSNKDIMAWFFFFFLSHYRNGDFGFAAVLVVVA